MVIFAAPDRLALAACLALTINALLYPSAVKRLLRWRWVIFFAVLLIPNTLWVGDADLIVMGVLVSSTGLGAGLHMVLRALTVLLAVDGFSSAVAISEVAGLLERIGLPGLGFSIGVAINLLPTLRKSSQNTWRSLYMRGGFGRKRWRALQLLLVTIVANALRRAEEIALAAEVRGFSPGRSRPLLLRVGQFDVVIAVTLLLLWVVSVLLT